MSVLLKRLGRLWMTECVVVCFVCSAWGSPAVVHAGWMAGEEHTQVAHRHIHKRRCDWWFDSDQSFLAFAASKPALSASTAAESGW
jgi:hypothetical protein